MGVAVRASPPPKRPEGSCKWASTDADGVAGLQARRGSTLSPHQLRHGFANRFLRESGRDVVALQALMGHSRPDTTQQYTDEVELDELADALTRAAEARMSQASPDLTTLEDEFADELQTLRWRRRESNPRPQSHRSEPLQA
jgi:integrase